MLRAVIQAFVDSKNFAALLSVVVFIQFVIPAAVWSGETPGTDLDLSSTQRSIAADSQPEFQPSAIKVGNTTRNINAGDMLTPAEHAALNQVLNSGTQNLLLGDQGNAVGGYLQLTPDVAQHISNLVVPANVSVINDFARTEALNLAGNLTNSGNLYGISTNEAVTSAVFNASNIFNNAGGLLTTVLPQSGLPGVTGALANLNLNLNLNAVNNIINAGTISSAGNLSLNAGGSIVNQATISAVQNIDIASMIGNITNSGTISAALGSINVSAATAQNIAINNVGGSLEALLGSINVRDASYAGSANLNLTGGDWLAEELNLYSGSGDILADLGNVSGSLSSFGDYAHVYAETPTLTLGEVKIDGDPVFANTGGNINITGNFAATENLVIAASGNVTATSGSPITVSATNGTAGADMWIIAGANLTNSGSNTTAVPGTEIGGGETLTVDLASPPGGNIDFTGAIAAGGLTLSTAATGGGSDGGNITLVAFANGDGTGKILMNRDHHITTSGDGAGANGNVTLIAGATTGDSIVPGLITAAGGAANTGDISISAAQPSFDTGTTLTFDSTGTVTSGNSFTPSGTIEDANILIRGNLTAGNSVTLSAGKDIVTQESLIASIPVGSEPRGAAFHPDGTFVYVPIEKSVGVKGEVKVIDTATNTVVATIEVGVQPQQVAVHPDGTVAYVSNLRDATVSVIDTGTNTVTDTIAVGTFPYGVVVSPDGSTLYVANGASDSVSVIDTATKTVTATIGLGDGPEGIAINPAGTILYVTNYFDNSLSIIDTATNKVVKTFTVGERPRSVAVNPAGNLVYVASSGGFAVIDTETNKIISSLNISHAAVSINPSGTLAYIPHSFDGVTILDTSINSPQGVVGEVKFGAANFILGDSFVGLVGNNVRAYVPDQNNNIRAIETPAIVAPQVAATSTTGNVRLGTNADIISANTHDHGIVNIAELGDVTIGQSSGGTITGSFFIGTPGAITTEGAITAADVTLQTTAGNNSITIGGDITATRKASFFANGSGNITVLDTLIKNIAVGGSPVNAAVNSAGTLAYIANQADNTVSVIDTVTNTVTATIPVGNSPLGVAVTPDGFLAYVANDGDDTVSVIDTTNNTVTKTLAVGANPQHVAVNPAGTLAYVVNNSDDTVSVIDVATNTAIATVPVGSSPRDVVVHTGNALIYVANGGDDTVSVIDIATNTVTETIPVGAGPAGIAMNPAGTIAYVANQNDNTISVIKIATNTVTETVAVGNAPAGVAVNPAGTFAYVTNRDGNTVSIIDTATNTVTKTVDVGAGSEPVATGNFVGIVSGNVQAYVPLNVPDQVAVIQMPTITSPDIIARSTTGDISLGTDAGTNSLEVSTGGSGNVNITELNEVGLGASRAGGSFILGTLGDITVKGAVSAEDLILQGTGKDSDIFIRDEITATNSLSLLAEDNVDHKKGVINAPNLVLSAPDGKIDTQLLRYVEAGAVSVSIVDTDNVRLFAYDEPLTLLDVDVDGQLRIWAAQPVTIQGQVEGNNIEIRTLRNNAGIDIQNNIVGTGENSIVTLRTAGSGNVTQAGGTEISADTLVLTGSSGSFGSAGNRLQTNVDNLSIRTLGGSDVFITETDGLTLMSSRIGNELNLISNGDTVLSRLSAGGDINVQVDSGALTQQRAGNLSTRNGNIALTTAELGTGIMTLNGTIRTMSRDLGGDITLGSAGGIQAGNSRIQTIRDGVVNINSVGNAVIGTLSVRDGAIIIDADGNLTIQPRKTVSSTNGPVLIGTNAGLTGSFDSTNARIRTLREGDVEIQADGDATVGQISTRNGSTAISGQSVTLDGSIRSLGPGDVDVIGTDGGVTVDDIFVQEGSVVIVANTGGALRLTEFSAIVAKGPDANVLLLHNGLLAGDDIILEPFAVINALASTAGNGNVTLSAGGGATPPQLAGNAPANVNTTAGNGGGIFFGEPALDPGITANGKLSILRAKGADVTFYIDLGHVDNQGAIVLESGNLIIADPPVGISTGQHLTVPASISTLATPSSTSEVSAPVLFTLPLSRTQVPVDATPVSLPVTQPVPVQELPSQQTGNSGKDSVFKPVAYRPSHTADFADSPEIISAHSRYAQLWHSGDTRFSKLAANHISIEKGELLLHVTQATVIQSGQYTIDISPSTTVLVSHEDGVTIVRNIHEGRHQTVRITVGSRHIKLAAGQECILGVHDGSTRKAFMDSSLGRRFPEAHLVDNRHHIIKSEISLVHLMQSSDILSSLYRNNDKHARSLMNRLIKTAACLHHVTSKRGQYQVLQPHEIQSVSR